MNTSVELRPYQKIAVVKANFFLKIKTGNPLIVAPTGSGKSLMIAALCRELINHKRILVLAHRKELLVQNAKAIRELNPDVSINFYSSALGKRDLTSDIIVAGISSIARVPLEKLPEVDYIIIDEAHLVNNVDAGQYRKLISDLQSKKQLRVVGFSATPFRLKGGFLHKSNDRIFTDIVENIPVATLMEMGHLSPLSSKSSAVEVDLEGLHTRAGEFIQAEYDAKFNDVDLIKTAVEDIIKHSGGRKSWLLFCSSIDHAENVAEELKKHGVSAMTVTGNTGQKERDVILKLFKEGTITAITNCDVLTVGFDAPNIDMIVLLRPTKSCGLYIQMVGRGTRLNPGKKNCLVLDYGENIDRFGPIDKIKIKQNVFNKVETESIPLKVCPECRECIEIKLKVCPSCDYQYPERVVDRKPKHNTYASNLDILKTSLMRSKYDGQQLLQVYDYDMQTYTKQGMPSSVKVDYWVSRVDRVPEWICPGHYGFAKQKADDWWIAHGGNDPVPKDAKEFINRRAEIKLADKISVEMVGSFPTIVKKIFKDSNIAQSLHG